jgi:hypothetical protein
MPACLPACPVSAARPAGRQTHPASTQGSRSAGRCNSSACTRWGQRQLPSAAASEGAGRPAPCRPGPACWGAAQGGRASDRQLPSAAPAEGAHCRRRRRRRACGCGAAPAPAALQLNPRTPCCSCSRRVAAKATVCGTACECHALSLGCRRACCIRVNAAVATSPPAPPAPTPVLLPRGPPQRVLALAHPAPLACLALSCAAGTCHHGEAGPAARQGNAARAPCHSSDAFASPSKGSASRCCCTAAVAVRASPGGTPAAAACRWQAGAARASHAARCAEAPSTASATMRRRRPRFSR